jgi:dihydrodipicolinate synthase/N-acetylneuraminate lyase
MASAFRPAGVFVPLVTPLDEADRVDADSLDGRPALIRS